jgi:acetyl-CoA synthetase
MTYWKPSKKQISESNISKMMQLTGQNSTQDFWYWSVAQKEHFWEKTMAALGIVFSQKHKTLLDISKGVENAKWLVGAQFNIVDSCFQNKSLDTAITFQKENGALERRSYGELEILVNKAANGLFEWGLKKRDVVAIAMPMTLEAVVIYLAAIKAGMIVATIADSFSVPEIETRLKITKPALVFTQDISLRKGKIHTLYKKITQATETPIAVVPTTIESLPKRAQDCYWKSFLSQNSAFESVKMSAEEAMTILFSSGTTGQPKAIPWNHVTPIKSASDAYYHHNIQKNDVLCWPTNLGWMMGPWLIFSAFINKASIALYYGVPFLKEFGAFVEQAEVTMLGVVPSLVKQWKASKEMEGFHWEKIKCFSSTGEVSNPEEMHYLMQLANNKPIVEYCGGTEIGGGYVASTLTEENIPSQFSSQTMGGAFVLLDAAGNLSSQGEVFLIPPILGLSTTLLNKNHYNTYYKGVPNIEGQVLRRHGDAMEKLENGYYKGRGRIDDAMNLGGIKISALQIETVIVRLDVVKECAAISVEPLGGGPSSLVVFYVAQKEMEKKEVLIAMQKQIKRELNPLFKVADLVKIDTLPRTASHKLKREELRSQYKVKRQA